MRPEWKSARDMSYTSWRLDHGAAVESHSASPTPKDLIIHVQLVIPTAVTSYKLHHSRTLACPGLLTHTQVSSSLRERRFNASLHSTELLIVVIPIRLLGYWVIPRQCLVFYAPRERLTKGAGHALLTQEASSRTSSLTNIHPTTEDPSSTMVKLNLTRPL